MTAMATRLSALSMTVLAGMCRAQGLLSPTPGTDPPMTVKAIEVVAVAEAEEHLLRTLLPIQVGNIVSRTELGATAKVVRELDAYLTFQFLATTLDDGRSEVRIRVAGVGGRPAEVYRQQPILIARVEPQYPESLRERGQ